MLLQHAIDGIVGTFYTQVLFADYELQAHRLVEEGQPVTADGLSEIYFDLFKAYHGDAIDYDEESRMTWARIPHFFSTPYYVYAFNETLKQQASAELEEAIAKLDGDPAGEPFFAVGDPAVVLEPRVRRARPPRPRLTRVRSAPLRAGRGRGRPGRPRGRLPRDRGAAQGRRGQGRRAVRRGCTPRPRLVP